MKIRHQGETVCISDLKELALANAAGFAEEARSAMATGAKSIVVDLSETGFLDCGGIGALIALRNNAQRDHHDISIRVVNPTPPVRRILQLTHLDNLLDSTPAELAA
ncbi:MAG TPA: STAS domain-containing protein [Verrucomicrobiae bacterium]|nr:STAS domain-containing protein [Verrucomicrobiae bacterium]